MINLPVNLQLVAVSLNPWLFFQTVQNKKSNLVNGFKSAVKFIHLIRSVPFFDSNFGRYVRDLGQVYKEFCVDVASLQVRMSTGLKRHL